jgi:hypothetical protein
MVRVEVRAVWPARGLKGVPFANALRASLVPQAELTRNDKWGVMLIIGQWTEYRVNENPGRAR